MKENEAKKAQVDIDDFDSGPFLVMVITLIVLNLITCI